MSTLFSSLMRGFGYGIGRQLANNTTSSDGYVYIPSPTNEEIEEDAYVVPKVSKKYYLWLFAGMLGPLILLILGLLKYYSKTTVVKYIGSQDAYYHGKYSFSVPMILKKEIKIDKLLPDEIQTYKKQCKHLIYIGAGFTLFWCIWHIAIAFNLLP